jgi:hypothetical protein
MRHRGVIVQQSEASHDLIPNREEVLVQERWIIPPQNYQADKNNMAKACTPCAWST